MNLIKIFEVQRGVDERVIKEKQLEGKDLRILKVLDAQVKIAQLADTWGGYKFPENPLERTVLVLRDTKDWWPESPPLEMAGEEVFEKYIECLHSVISLGNEIGVDPDDISVSEAENVGGIQQLLSDLMLQASFSLHEWPEEKRNHFFRKHRHYYIFFVLYMNLGEMFGFKLERIEQEFLKSIEKKHRRIYKFDDGNSHWIVACSQKEAEEYFVHDYSGNSEYTVTEITAEEANKKLWCEVEEQHVSWALFAKESSVVPNCLGDDSGYC